MFQLAPSLLAANFWNLGTEVTEVVDAGAQVLHIDVMDGHFVPNLTMGSGVVRTLKGRTSAILDVHLMVSDPDSMLEGFAAAGANWISFHIEAVHHPHRTCQAIKKLGCKAGVAINPGTPIASVSELVEDLDFVLLMSVNPGFGGQAFIERTYKRLETLSAMIAGAENKPFIQVDGGIGPGNIAALHAAGMQVAVAGSSVFSQESPRSAVKNLITLAEGVHDEA